MVQSLINKYRPVSFDQVIGQDKTVNSLREIVERDDVHTFLFMGPSGCGKTTLARIVAEAVGCDPAGIVEIDAATNTSIDDTRKIIEFSQYKPVLSVSKKRAIIVDECHALSRSATQSLLKTLEEPPAYQYWFLCTTESWRMPTTIETRSAKFTLEGVDRNNLYDLLTVIVEAEDFKTPRQVIDACVDAAEYSPRQAISNLAICAHLTDREQAQQLLQSTDGAQGAYELAKAMQGNSPWTKLREIIADLTLKGANAEGVRHIVQDYFAKTIIKSERYEGKWAIILEEFKGPFSSTDGMAPVIVAVMAYLSRTQN